jgi:hypothetical protein
VTTLKELQEMAPQEGRSKGVYDEITRLRWYEGFTPQSREEHEAGINDRVCTVGMILLELAGYANGQGFDLEGCLGMARRVIAEDFGEEVEEETDGEQADE